MPNARPSPLSLRPRPPTRVQANYSADQVVLDLFNAFGRLRETLDSLYTPAGLNEHKFLVLSALASLAPEPSLPSELARFAGITRSSMTDVLDDLEQRGWIERRRDPADRRVIRVSLTATGDAVLRAAQRHFETVCRDLLRGMEPAELARFAEMWTTVDRASSELRKRMPIFHPSLPSR